MIRVLVSLGLALCLFSAIAAEDEGSEAHGYTLSMAGALINDNCERNWKASGYISVFACNYELAQLYNLAMSAQHFNQCAQFSRGDIIKIADCMTNQFNVWITEHQHSPSVKSP